MAESLVDAIAKAETGRKQETRLLDDHWTVVTADGLPSVHYEHTVAMTAEGPVILTEGLGAPPD